MQPFNDAAMVAEYTETTPRKVPGLADLHRMTMLLLAEAAPRDARILALGAGGGLELRAFAEAQPSWRFVGVDPSGPMLEIARGLLSPFEDRIELQQGNIDSAPPGPFDGATCLLTLHFLDKAERIATLEAIRRRLRPGAKLVVAHHSAPEGAEPRLWLSRSAAFGDRSGVDFERAWASSAAMAERLRLLAPEDEAAVLKAAGFADVALFYAAFSFRGWVASA